MKNRRVIYNGYSYRAQERYLLFFWRDLYEGVPGFGNYEWVGTNLVETYPTKNEAMSAICRKHNERLKERYKKQWVTVYEGED